MRFRWLKKAWPILRHSIAPAPLKHTDPATNVLQFANREARRLNHEYIGTEHILLGLITDDNSVAALVLKSLKVEPSKVRTEVEKIARIGPDVDTTGKLPQTPRARNVIKYSMEEARSLNHNYVGTEHVLLGLLREQEGFAAVVLMNLGLTVENTRNQVIRALANKTPATGTQ